MGGKGGAGSRRRGGPGGGLPAQGPAPGEGVAWDPPPPPRVRGGGESRASPEHPRREGPAHAWEIFFLFFFGVALVA